MSDQDQAIRDANARGRAEMKAEVLRCIARRRLSASGRDVTELTALVEEISKL